MVCLPALRFFAWDTLSLSDMSLVLAELYQLFDQKRPAAYAVMNSQSRHEHRELMAQFMINNQHILGAIYQLDPGLAQRNENRMYALLFVLAEIAVTFHRTRYAAGAAVAVEVDIARIIIDELFYFAFAWQSGNPQPSPAVMGVRVEAQNAVRLLNSKGAPPGHFAVSLMTLLVVTASIRMRCRATVADVCGHRDWSQPPGVEPQCCCSMGSVSRHVCVGY
jgi:hypothetical protein